ncbi:MAG: O-antigen ligase family protein [Caldilineaceae bacterium]|nr:O-antigen ligase family protein [Caldilineaceae bacterium]
MRKIAFWLSLAFIFSIPWENSVVLPGLGSIARIIGLLATASWMGKVLFKGELRRPHLFHLAMFAYIAWNAATIFWSIKPDNTFNRIETYIQLFIFSLLIWDLLDNRESLDDGLQMYILGGGVAIVSTIFIYFAGVGVRGGIRYAASGFDPNDMGITLAIGMPMAWYLATSSRERTLGWLLRLINYAYIPGAVMAILLAASRTSLIATAPASLYVLMTFSRLRLMTRIIVFSILIYALFIIQPLIPESSFQRLSQTGDSIASGNLTGRVDIWREGYQVFAAHPLNGVGSGTFRDAIDKKKAPHNVFVALSTETGLIGITLIGLILLVVIQQIWRHPSWTERLLWTSILSIWFLGAITLNWEYRKPTWLLFLLIVCSANVLSKQPKAAKTAPVRQELLPLRPEIALKR